MTQTSTRGGCLCGKIRLRLKAAPLWCGYCHCRSCRRFTGSVVTNWVGVRHGDLEFTDGQPAVYEIDGVRRGFCPACGSSLTYAAERFPDYVQLHLGCLDQAEGLRPETHVHCAEKIPWFEVDDDLPRYQHSMADEAGGWNPQ